MDEARYSRFLVLSDVGLAGLKKLQASHVTVVGMGGLGCVSAAQLAALGVGTVRIVDYDVVELSNLQRQQLYTQDDIGLPKVEVAQKRLLELNPNIRVEPMALKFTDMSADRLIKGTDVVIDGLDRFAPRFALNRACVRHAIPYVFGGALANTGNITTIIPRETPCLECILGDMEDIQPSCAVVGVYSTLLGVIGNLQVQEALHLILGLSPKLANQLLFFDISNFTLDLLPINRYTECSVCGTQKPHLPPSPAASLIVTELCDEKTYLVSSNNPIPIDIQQAAKLLKPRYVLIRQSVMGLQIQWNNQVQVSIVGEGNILVKGVSSPTLAESIYHEVMEEIRAALHK